MIKDEETPDNFLVGYLYGNKGPTFHKMLPFKYCNSMYAEWPRWTDHLTTVRKIGGIEGGLRMQGIFKQSQPGRPLISYITVVRNNAKTIARSITSAQTQTYSNVEHIILDGASTDGTIEIIKQFSGNLDYFASEPDKGLYDALNKAIPLARGDYICVLNSDDWLEPNAAEIAIKYLPNNQSNNLLLTAAKVHDSTEIHCWPPALVHPGSIFTCPNVCHNGIYASRLAYVSSGPYDTTYDIAADTKWVIQCFCSGAELRYSDEPTINYSLGGISCDFHKHSIEFMRTLKERFAFLTDEEIFGLYHSFFVFSNRDNKITTNIPMNREEFIKKIFIKYSSHLEFVISLSWANLLTTANLAIAPSMPICSLRLVLKQAIKKRLSYFPGVYKIVKFIYRKLFLRELLNG